MRINSHPAQLGQQLEGRCDKEVSCLRTEIQLTRQAEGDQDLSALSTENDARPSSPSTRLVGVELFRGVAAFGVIAIHSGLVVGNALTAEAGQLPRLFDFAVPFFLAAALYFAALSLARPAAQTGGWLRKRLERLLFPYVAWTLIYTAAQGVKMMIQSRTEELGKLLVDPANRIFLGGAAFIFISSQSCSWD